MEEPQKKGCKNLYNGCRTKSGLFVVEQDKLQSTNHLIFIAATRSAVLSEVLNGTDHLRGVGVLVVVPGHDLNLIGVVAATLNFCAFPSISSQFRNISYSTRTYRCRTKTGLFVLRLYHVSASFARIWFVSLLTCIFQISAYISTTFHGSNALGLGLPPGQQLSQAPSSEALWQLDWQHAPAD